VEKQLRSLGWTVLRFWGKDIIKNTQECVDAVEECIFDSKFQDNVKIND